MAKVIAKWFAPSRKEAAFWAAVFKAIEHQGGAQ